jgi:hypothetical protein
MAAASLRMPLRTSFGILPKVTRVVMDFGFNFYFRAQRLSWWQRLRCTPMLFRAEYMVFRADAVAESAKDVDLDPARNKDHDTVRRYKATFEAYKARFVALLRRAHAHNDAVARQLALGEEYLYLENKVTSNHAASHAEVIRLAELRSFDLRLLHGMTFALLGRPVDNDLLDLLWPVEVLHDIADDVATYHQDIAAGLFNTYDAFVSLYGPAAPERLRAETARYEQLFRAELAKFPADRQAELEAICTRRYRALTEDLPEPQLHHRSQPHQPEGTP